MRETREVEEPATPLGAGAPWAPTSAILRVIVVALAVAATLWTLYALRDVLLLVVLAIFFAYLLAPLVECACRPFTVRGRTHVMPRGLAIGVVYLLISGALAIAAALLLPQIGAQVTQLAQEAPGYLDLARSRALGWTSSYEEYRLPAAVRDAIDKSAAHAAGVAGTYVTEPLHPFAVIVAVLCGATLAGVPGIFLAIPTVAIISVGYRHWLDHTGSEGLVADLPERRE